jgi:sporulation protein YlmC with PRC-barrel domain
MARNRDTRDRAGQGPDPDRGVRLVPIDRLRDFRIAKDDPDIRGWEVRTLSGRQIGNVKDLLVDPEAGEVVMMEIELANDDRHTLAPIRAAQIDRDRNCVIIDSADVERGYRRVGEPAAYDERAARDAADARDVREAREAREAEAERDAHEAEAERDAETRDRARAPAEPLAKDEEEVVVERRPVVYEEVVVRRKDVSEGTDEPRERTRHRDDPA